MLDFYCPASRLCIEIDGHGHDTADRPLRDARRDLWLADQGIEVLRIAARDVLVSPEQVAEALIRRCAQ